jgi:hypothetical protein
MKRKLLPVVLGSLWMIAMARKAPAQPAPAAPPTTAPVTTAAPTTQPAARQMRPIIARLLKMQNAAAVTGEISNEEWKKVEDFMQLHSPERLRQLQRLPAEKMSNVKRAMVGRFRTLEEIRKSDPTLYDIWVQKLEVEDDHFILLREWRRARTDPKETEAKLRNNVAEAVRLELDERQHRLENLQHAVDEEKVKLAEDRQNEDNLIDEQLKRAMTGQEYRFGEGPRRGPDGARAVGARPDGARPEGIREASVDAPTTAPEAK